MNKTLVLLASVAGIAFSASAFAQEVKNPGEEREQEKARHEHHEMKRAEHKEHMEKHHEHHEHRREEHKEHHEKMKEEHHEEEHH